MAVAAMGLMIYAEASGVDAEARPRLWGWALALFLFAGFTFVVDHFSEERALTYARRLAE